MNLAKTRKLDQIPQDFPTNHQKSGQVFVVGSGDCGQLGLGPEIFESHRPKLLSYFDDKDIIRVFAGGLHNIVLSGDGKKALGRTGEETVPLPVEGLDGLVIVDVACGDSITCCLTNEGKVYAWGTFRCSTGIYGFSPTGSENDQDTQEFPKLIPELKDVLSISTGSNHIVAISNSGKIYTWGVGEQNQLGRKILGRKQKQSSLTPRSINFKPYKLSSKYLKVYCGSYHTFLVHESNKIFAFGLNNYGQLGVGTCDQYDLPHIVEGLPEGVNITKACGGEHHSMVLTSEGSFFSNIGKVYVFGRGDSGQLGLESSKLHLALEGAVNLPVGSGKVTSISCGGSFSLAVTDEDGNNLYMWGYGEMGQLSNGCVDAEEPFCVELKGRKVIEAAGGGQHSILLIQPK